MRVRLKVCCIASVDEARLAIAHVEPFGIDVCSGLHSDGRLDRDRLSRLVRAARA
jgi:phosphoribosylanthranilate isomerase